MLLFYQVATRLSLTTCRQIVESQDDNKLLEQVVGTTCNKSIELNILVAIWQQSRWQFVNKLGTSSANTSCQWSLMYKISSCLYRALYWISFLYFLGTIVDTSKLRDVSLSFWKLYIPYRICDFRQSVDWLFSHRSVIRLSAASSAARIELTISEVKGAWNQSEPRNNYFINVICYADHSSI
jgi:hypothetical protein